MDTRFGESCREPSYTFDLRAEYVSTVLLAGLCRIPILGIIMLNKSIELIKSQYGEGVAARSGVPLMNHIIEGIAILDKIGANQEVKAAFALHPIAQINMPVDVPNELAQPYALAKLYSVYANYALCSPSVMQRGVVTTLLDLPEMPKEVAQMLYADKMQNQKDFIMYHQGKHVNSDKLTEYFDTWVDYLIELLGKFDD